MKNTKSLGVTPLGDRVLVMPESEEHVGKTKGGIYIPETVTKEKAERGKIVAVGPGKRNEKGDIVPMSVKVGQKVLFSKYSPDEVKVEDVEYFIIREDSILAILD